ncbi:TPA: hypothetical protein ACKFLT_004390 [Citrobacter koseri]
MKSGVWRPGHWKWHGLQKKRQPLSVQ